MATMTIGSRLWGIIVMTLLLVASSFVGSLHAPGAPIPDVTSILPCDPEHAHAPIHITSDEGPRGFILERHPDTGDPVYRPGSGVVAGNGTVGDPFVISGWCIVVPPLGNGVWLEGTSAHVLVRNTTVVSEDLEGEWGVLLQDARNVTLKGNVLRSLERGVHADVAPGVEIVGNTFNASGYAVTVKGSHGSVVAANDIVGRYWPNRGIALRSTWNATVEDNHVQGVREEALLLKAAEGNRITGNELVGNDEGMILKGSNGNHIEGNAVVGNDWMGAQFVASSNNTIQGNRFVGNDHYALLLERSHDNLIEGNNVSANTFHGLAVEGDRNEVRNNTVAGNRWSGIILRDHARWNVVSRNTIRENGGDGVGLWGASNSTIQGNDISGNHRGILVESHWAWGWSRGNHIHGNNIWNHTDLGLEALYVDEFVNATRNWWGCPDGPEDPACDGVSFYVTYEPWLASPNLEAGAG